MRIVLEKCSSLESGTKKGEAFGVRNATHNGVWCLISFVNNSASPKHVVDDNHAPGTNQFQQQLIVDVIIMLICIYECEVS